MKARTKNLLILSIPLILLIAVVLILYATGFGVKSKPVAVVSPRYNAAVYEAAPDYTSGYDETSVIESDDSTLEHTSFGGSDILKDSDGKISNVAATKEYILAFDKRMESTEKNGIYRININTNETVRISKHEAMGFRREWNFLYYVSEGALYRIYMSAGTEGREKGGTEYISEVGRKDRKKSENRDRREEFVKQLTHTSADISRFEIIGGKCYWIDAENNILYDNDGNNVNGDAECEGLKIGGDQSKYLICTFAETKPSEYHLMILDKSGAAVFKTPDTARIDSVNIMGTTLTFVNLTTGTICKTELK
ncbi:MAG: hypothetical protein LBL49_07970 [Clostridiales Family XIII bacterium]|jgi:hypothetical protein|nr:hypothetical protein [Clostridiales Family XIII bacterium]